MTKFELLFWTLMGVLFLESWGRAALVAFRSRQEEQGRRVALERCACEES